MSTSNKLFCKILQHNFRNTLSLSFIITCKTRKCWTEQKTEDAKWMSTPELAKNTFFTQNWKWAIMITQYYNTFLQIKWCAKKCIYTAFSNKSLCYFTPELESCSKCIPMPSLMGWGGNLLWCKALIWLRKPERILCHGHRWGEFILPKWCPINSNGGCSGAPQVLLLKVTL